MRELRSQHGRPTRNVKAAQPLPKKPVVYFVQADSGLIKIGTTGNIEWRLKTLRGQSPVPLTLLATVRGTRTDEHEYHRRFAHARRHGEWFERCPEIEAEIARLTAKECPNAQLPKLHGRA